MMKYNYSMIFLREYLTTMYTYFMNILVKCFFTQTRKKLEDNEWENIQKRTFYV